MIETNSEKLERLYAELDLVDAEFDKQMLIACWVLGAEVFAALWMIALIFVKNI